jgi:hypothetical protein
MNPSHKSQMEILSSFRSRIVKLNLLPSVDVEMKNLDYSVNIEKETYNLDVTLVKLNNFISIIIPIPILI